MLRAARGGARRGPDKSRKNGHLTGPHLLPEGCSLCLSSGSGSTGFSTRCGKQSFVRCDKGFFTHSRPSPVLSDLGSRWPHELCCLPFWQHREACRGRLLALHTKPARACLAAR